MIRREGSTHETRVARDVSLRVSGDDAGDDVLMLVMRENPREVRRSDWLRKLEARIIARRDNGMTNGADLRARSGGEELYAVTTDARIVVGKFRDVDARNGFDFVARRAIKSEVRTAYMFKIGIPKAGGRASSRSA